MSGKLYKKNNKLRQEEEQSSPPPEPKSKHSALTLADSIKTLSGELLHDSPAFAPATITGTNKRLRSVQSATEAILKRRENHRIVEKRRRETINNGISELSRVIPGHPKNRGKIVLKAIEHIRELKRIASEATEEAAALREENSLLVEELANKNRKINDLLLKL